MLKRVHAYVRAWMYACRSSYIHLFVSLLLKSLNLSACLFVTLSDCQCTIADLSVYQPVCQCVRQCLGLLCLSIHSSICPSVAPLACRVIRSKCSKQGVLTEFTKEVNRLLTSGRKCAPACIQARRVKETGLPQRADMRQFLCSSARTQPTCKQQQQQKHHHHHHQHQHHLTTR